MERVKGRSLLEFPDNYLVLDIETTGYSTNYDKIIEVAGIKYVDGIPVETFKELVNPGVRISNQITDWKKITNDMLVDARSTADVILDFYNFCKDWIIVGHNVNFDINFLYDALWENYGLQWNNDFVCTLKLSRLILPELSHHTLGDIAYHYKVISPDPHRALNDVETTFSIFNALKNECSEKYGDIEELCRIARRHKYQKKKESLNVACTVENIDPSNFFYGKACCFTGTLERMLRKEAMQYIVNLGALNCPGVSSKTDYLILGNFDYRSSLKGKKSSKLKKAEIMQSEGSGIQILSEDMFYNLIENKGMLVEDDIDFYISDFSREKEDVISETIPGNILVENIGFDSDIIPGDGENSKINNIEQVLDSMDTSNQLNDVPEENSKLILETDNETKHTEEILYEKSKQKTSLWEKLEEKMKKIFG